MKYIKPINEFFNLFKKDEEDEIALEFIKRLEKVKNSETPYTIKKLSKDDLQISFTSDMDSIYSVLFDDVTLLTAYGMSVKIGSTIPRIFCKFMIDGDQINCKKSYSRKIFNLVSDIYERDIKKNKLDKIKSNLNPAADLL